MPELENDAPRWVNPPILPAWTGDRGVGYSPKFKYCLFPRNRMSELTEAQRKRYEEVREWLKNILILAKAPEQGDVPFEEFWSAQILKDPRIAILDGLPKGDEDKKLDDEAKNARFWRGETGDVGWID